MKFTLEIELGSQDMQTLGDVIRVLRKSKDTLADGDEALTEGDSDVFRWSNNGLRTNGKWEVTA